MEEKEVIDRETRIVKGEVGELVYESEDFTLVDQQPLDNMKHGWLKYRLVFKEDATGKFFVTYARYNDDWGWEDSYGDIELTEVFLKKKMVAFYE